MHLDSREPRLGGSSVGNSTRQTRPTHGVESHGDSAPPRGAGVSPAGGEAVSLDNNAKSSRKRTDRWVARGFNWKYSELPRCRKCGRFAVTTDGTVGVRADGNSVGYAGLATCGSVWSCPVCNSRIQNVRRLEIGVALANLHANGGGAGFGAITVRHNSGQSLLQTVNVLTYGIARIARDKTVAALRAEMGYIGRVQALEVTHGAHGWHPHRHPLVMFSAPPDPGALAELHLAEFRAFAAGVIRKGYESPLDLAQVMMPVQLGSDDVLSDYFTKSSYTAEGAGWELTSSQSKSGRKKTSRTPWQLLESARTTGDMDDLELWNEYELAMKGRRALTFSRGLRDLLGIGKEATDEQIAAEEIGDRDDTGFRVMNWEPIGRNAALGAGLLNAVTPAGNWSAGREYAAKHGIEIGEV